MGHDLNPQHGLAPADKCGVLSLSVTVRPLWSVVRPVV